MSVFPKVVLQRVNRYSGIVVLGSEHSPALLLRVPMRVLALTPIPGETIVTDSGEVVTVHLFVSRSYVQAIHEDVSILSRVPISIAVHKSISARVHISRHLVRH
jgi:hypothetical protein